MHENLLRRLLTHTGAWPLDSLVRGESDPESSLSYLASGDPKSVVKLRVLSHVLSWLTSGQVYKTSREDPEIGFVMGWPTTR